MSEPTAEQWERIEEMIGRHPDWQGSIDLQAVLDYVDELQARLSNSDALAGLTPEQVEAIPRLVSHFTASKSEMNSAAWEANHYSLRTLFPRRRT